MSDTVLVSIISGIFLVAVSVTGGIFQKGHKQKEREKQRDAEVRQERNTKDAVERKKNRAHDALTRQIAWHLIHKNDLDRLLKRHSDALEAETEWAEKERLFYERLDEIETKYQ